MFGPSLEVPRVVEAASNPHTIDELRTTIRRAETDRCDGVATSQRVAEDQGGGTTSLLPRRCRRAMWVAKTLALSVCNVRSPHHRSPERFAARPNFSPA